MGLRFLQWPHHGAVNVTRTSFVSSKATSSKLWTSRIKASGGGGGLMFDFTPDFAVMLKEYISTGRPHKYSERTKKQVRQGLGRLRKARCCLSRQTTLELNQTLSMVFVEISYGHLLGYPVTPYFCPKGLPTPSASTLATTTLPFACENASPSCSYIGARF